MEEEDVLDYSSNNKGSFTSKKHFTYQQISCKFGRFGETSGLYVNRTLIKCLTPGIKDDSDIGYEEVNLELALNGQDFEKSEEFNFTFVGPNVSSMLWVYVLITIFVALIIIVSGALISSFWNKIAMQLQETKSRNVYSGDQPHVIDRRPRYLIPELRNDLNQNFIIQEQEQNERRNLERIV